MAEWREDEREKSIHHGRATHTNLMQNTVTVAPQERLPNKFLFR